MKEEYTKMRCYRFYKVPTEEEAHYIDTRTNGEPHIEDKYVLYATTNSKKIAKEFRNMRNMKRFYEVCSDDITKEEYKVFANRNRSTVLEEHDLLTVKNKYEKNQEIIRIPMIITMAEYQFIYDVTDDTGAIFDENEWYAPAMSVANPVFFDNKCRRALDFLGYSQQYYLYRAQYYDDRNVYSETGDDIDYNMPLYTIDEFEIFLAEYGDLIK